MKTGYLALFGMIVAYSACQGTTPTGTTSIRETSVSKASEQEEKAALRLLGAGANQTEAFPTISGGICKLRLDGTRTSPCGPCTALCPADDLRNLLTDYFQEEVGKDEAPEELAAHWNVPRLERPRIKFVIATLPDPVHTHMALWPGQNL
jgi:hypothetical protein